MSHNTFIPAQVVINAFLADLSNEVVLPTLCARNWAVNFTGGVGSSIDVRRPTTLKDAAGAAVTAGRTYDNTDRTAPIVIDEITQTSFTVSMGPQIYQGVRITDDDLTMELIDFQDQVMRPVTVSAARGVSALVKAQIDGVAAKNSIDAVDDDGTAVTSVNSMNPLRTLAAMKVKLDTDNVPTAGRTLVVSPDVQLPFLMNPQLLQANTSGDGGQKMREASIGRVMGFDIYVAEELDAGTAVAFVPEALQLITRAPVTPVSVAYSASAAFAGVAFRVLRDYDADYLQDRLIVSAYAACSLYTEDSAGTVKRALALDFGTS